MQSAVCSSSNQAVHVVHVIGQIAAIPQSILCSARPDFLLVSQILSQPIFTQSHGVCGVHADAHGHGQEGHARQQQGGLHAATSFDTKQHQVLMQRNVMLGNNRSQ